MEYNTNLLTETLEALATYNKGPLDVIWVGNHDGTLACTWEKFAELIKDLCYNAGYGSLEIPIELVVVGSGWWLERSEYDGAEDWVFKTIPVKRNPEDFYLSKHKFGSWQLREFIEGI
jgi:hypothetical protein